MTDFDDRTVLVTGGGSGMGLAVANQVVAGGGNAVLVGRDAAKLNVAAKHLTAAYGDAAARVMTAPADVSDVAALERVAESVKQRYGRLDGVFANAGVGVFARTDEMTEATFDHVVSVNFKGVYFTIQKSLDLLPDGGSVVINASWTTYRGMASGAVYSATKAAVANLTRTLATDLTHRGIRVNSVSPGYIATDMFNGLVTTDEYREALRTEVPMGRLGEPDDVAEVVCFLLSDRARYVTGQDILVDGGLAQSIPIAG